MVFSSLANEESRLDFVWWVFSSGFCHVSPVFCLAEKLGLAASTFAAPKKSKRRLDFILYHFNTATGKELDAS